MSIRVSVVVPVYNGGACIEPCIDSLLGQSLPRDQYEVIFVDDGSIDGTPARLDKLAAEQPNVTVIHIPNSGWPGKPRNVGIDHAAGEFIQFVDHDDYLGAETLERLYAYGVANEADVVIGKMVGIGRGVPRELFRRNLPQANVENASLVDSMTVHKMFRRSFLNDIGLRFPEGKRRLEDHVFVIEAYLRARNVSVLSDYTCYYHTARPDASNIAFQGYQPLDYYKNLREALDVVERYTEPGPVRDRLMRRWLRNEVVERIRSPKMLAWPVEYRGALFREMHLLTAERFGPGVLGGLPALQRAYATLAKENLLADAIALYEWERGVQAHSYLRELAWDAGVLSIACDAEFHCNGAPVQFGPSDDAVMLRPPLDADGLRALAALDVDLSVRPATFRGTLVLRDRDTRMEFIQPSECICEVLDAADAVRVVVRVVARIDPTTAAASAALGPGMWDVSLRLNGCGWSKDARVGADRAPEITMRAGVVIGEPARRVRPRWTRPDHNLSLLVFSRTGQRWIGPRYTPRRVARALKRRTVRIMRRMTS